MKGFNKEDSSILGFVIYCEGIAITFNEFKEYLYFVIKNNSIDDLPNFIWDLIDLEEENKLHIYDIIGFATSDNFTKGEIMAMYGIGIKRFGEIYDMPISKKAALKALDQYPSILKRFKETFPFIKIED